MNNQTTTITYCDTVEALKAQDITITGQSIFELVTDEQINIAIAEWMSFRVFRPSEIKMRSNYDQECCGIDKGLYILPKKKRPQTHMLDARPLPRFTESLDLVHQAEMKALGEFLPTCWWNALVSVRGSAVCSDVATATASQRARAIYALIKSI
jgi:hypothetical protein